MPWRLSGITRRGTSSPILSQAVKWKVLPLPGSESTQMRPSIISIRRLQIVSPRPVPPKRRVVEPSA